MGAASSGKTGGSGGVSTITRGVSGLFHHHVEIAGFYIDANHYKPGTWAGTRMISDSTGDKSGEAITIIGSDDGIAFWIVQGRWTNKNKGKFVVDFSPKGGPSGKAKFCSRGSTITWPDAKGHAKQGQWKRHAAVPQSKPDSMIAQAAFHMGGFYTDPAHHWPGTLAGSRMISGSVGDKSGDAITIVGSDDGTIFWTVKGQWTNKNAGDFVVDFSPKGGPANLQGKFRPQGMLAWPDGNHWQRHACPEFEGTGTGMIDATHHAKATSDVAPESAKSRCIDQGRIEGLVQSPVFHLAVLLVAALNAIALGIEIEMTSSRLFADASSTTSVDSPSSIAKSMFSGIELKIAFLVVYVVELTLRISAVGPLKLVKNLKNLDLLLLVDLVVIACIAADVVTHYLNDEPLAIWGVSVLKVLRVFNVLVLLPLPAVCDELCFIVRNLVGAVRTSLWISLALGSVVYVSSLLFTKVLGHGYPENEVIQKYWGTIPRSSFTLFAFATQQWEGVARYLWDIDPGMVVASVIFIVVASIALLNLAIASMVRNAMGQAEGAAQHNGGLTNLLKGIDENLDRVLAKQADHEARLTELKDSLTFVMAEMRKPSSPLSFSPKLPPTIPVIPVGAIPALNAMQFPTQPNLAGGWAPQQQQHGQNATGAKILQNDSLVSWIN